MPNADGTPSMGEPGYLAPNTGLLTTTSTPPPVPIKDPLQATASTATSAGYDPSKYVMTPDQTVEGRAAKIVGDDSVLMQQARTRANQDAQAKGLLSSSTAVQAGQNAVLDKAIPIASQDATAYNQAMIRTADSENAAKNFGAAASNQAALANAQLVTDVSKVNAGMGNELNLAYLDANTRTQLANLDATTRNALAVLDAQNRQLLQTNTNAQNMVQQVVTDITNISTNATMSKGAKDAAVATQLELLREGLALTAKVSSTEFAALNSLNLSQYFKEVEPTSTAAPGSVIPTPGTFAPQPALVPTPKPAPPPAPVRNPSSGRSDRRDKMNLKPVLHGLDFINALAPTEFQYRTDRASDVPMGRPQYGFLAQDVLVLEGENAVIVDNDDPENLYFHSPSMVAVLVKAVQELSAEVAQLKAERLGALTEV
jgi:hypothetical protein